ncbi:MAG: helix-hairpin-helix domain-containing protein [Cellulosilyticaceae bacterium]
MIKLINQYKVVALIILLIIVNFLFIFGQKLFSNDHIFENGWTEEQFVASSTPSQTVQETLSETSSMLVDSTPVTTFPVFICGEIKHPGVYYVTDPVVIDDIVKLAGGFTDLADPNVVNLAMRLKGNEKIYIPQVGEAVTQTLMEEPVSDGLSGASDFININTANQDTLETLPGIGAAKAQQIIKHRETKGDFKTIDALQDVSGIGVKTFEGLKHLITIE